MGALDLIVDVAPRHHASMTDRLAAAATFSVKPPLPSGAAGPGYLILVEDYRNGISAREVVPSRLPAFCPERHINFDGTFCLQWAELEPVTFRQVDDAAGWWLKVLAFLDRQRIAGKLRRWPGKGDARAHGPQAARHQAAAEHHAGLMGPSFEKRLNEGRLRAVSRNRHGQTRIRLMSAHRRVCTVVPIERRVMTTRTPCPCDGNALRRRPLHSCHDHAETLIRLTLALREQEREEQLFFDEIREKAYACCGTLDDCPLAAPRIP